MDRKQAARLHKLGRRERAGQALAQGECGLLLSGHEDWEAARRQGLRLPGHGIGERLVDVAGAGDGVDARLELQLPGRIGERCCNVEATAVDPRIEALGASL